MWPRNPMSPPNGGCQVQKRDRLAASDWACWAQVGAFQDVAGCSSLLEASGSYIGLACWSLAPCKRVAKGEWTWNDDNILTVLYYLYLYCLYIC